ncbi:MAG: tRNA (adenosine(37)-N6)-threonylcarbamoyltransferase complex dimerization subunit type 1 TsaB, partial [Ilumatobacteraceae bacterium]
MLILGIETATQQVSVAIGGHEGVLGQFEVARGRRHAETLTPAIEFLCRQADIQIAEFGAIAVDVGPGLFTGMRVGLAAGKAMAQALRVPMIGISSLDLLAFPLRYADRPIAAVIDARKGELFYAFYRPVPGGVQRVTEPRCGKVDDLVGDILARGQNVICVGDGALRYRDEI